MQTDNCILSLTLMEATEEGRDRGREEGQPEGWRPISPDASLAHGLLLFGEITPLRAASPRLLHYIHWQALGKVCAGGKRGATSRIKSQSRFFFSFSSENPRVARKAALKQVSHSWSLQWPLQK